MEPGIEHIQWAPKVEQAKLKRLYQLDARGIVDEEAIDKLGWALWARCDSILTVTAAHSGRVRCPVCEAQIERRNTASADELVLCQACGWQVSWAAYHKTYQGKQLFGANAVDVFAAYHRDFPPARSPAAKMLLIDQLIHAFHSGLSEPGRPAGANLIQGSLAEVISFLDALTNDGASATVIGNSRAEWRRTLEQAAWSAQFLEPDSGPSRSKVDGDT